MAYEATENDGVALQALFEDCADFFDLTTGLLPGPAEVQSLFTAIPAGTTYDDKTVISLLDKTGALIGVMDVVRNYPEPEEWWVGLMLLRPEHRGRGLGARIFQSFRHWAAAGGAKRIGLAVKAQNEKAFRFWQRMGFEVIGTRPPIQLGAKLSVVTVMRLDAVSTPAECTSP